MKKILSIILLVAVIFVQNSGVLPVLADGLRVTSTRVGQLENGTAMLSWYTNEKSKAIVYYGLNASDLDNSRAYFLYTTSHELKLSNLQKSKTYYYRIIATSESGESVETFVQSFSTKGMKDTILPRFLDTKVYQITKDAVAIGWETDERTKGSVYYGTDLENLNKKKTFGYGTTRTIYLYNLSPNTKYYIRVVAKDSSSNTRKHVFIIETNNLLSRNTDLEIRNITPTNFDGELVFANQVNLTWHTDIISKGMISYGTSPNSLKSKAYSNNKELAFNHQIILEDLVPNTTYYYRIKAYDALYDRTRTTNIMSFTTVPGQGSLQDDDATIDEEVLGKKIFSEGNFGSITLDKSHAYNCHEFDNLAIAENFYFTYKPLGYDVYRMNTNRNSKICERIKFKNANITKKYISNTAITPQVLGIKVTSPFVSGTDSDGDGLPDTFEAQIATNPFNPDTDGDGYDDGTEIANNYNPHGPGKIYEKIYDQHRMNDDLVATKANELKYHLEQADVDMNDIGSLEWVYLLNAYVYGEYPAEAVIQAIKYGGRTVHPTVPWKFWRNSDDYNYFINRE